MEKEQILSMDPYILLGWTNMKLRDYFSSLDILCEEFDITNEEIAVKLKSIGYSYNSTVNQFVSI